MTIDAASTALLVIDILVTESPDAVYATNPEEEALVANAAQLTRAARGAGMPVLFLCDQHIPGIDRELSLWGEHGMRGEAHPHPALEAGTASAAPRAASPSPPSTSSRATSSSPSAATTASSRPTSTSPCANLASRP